ncbi:MAG: phosphoribosyl-AMP cyclohydrolase [Candidatus Pacebacteria bacterium]|nr:phosphoribosyl-AMP cyclohydrolase [Candidatus Paceibacterota bacterium]
MPDDSKESTIKINDAEELIRLIDWEKVGFLVPVITQHYLTGKVLMLGYMNQEALRGSLQKGRMIYYSRTRQCLWEKGGTSGDFQFIKSMRLDCDNDTLLVKVKQIGSVCHTGNKSCFYKKYNINKKYADKKDKQ